MLSKFRSSKYFFLLGILFIGIVLRNIYLNQHDIWFDEAFSYFVAKSSLHDILVAASADNHPPLYELMLHFWIRIFGTTAIAMRSLSLTTGILSLPIFYLLTKKLVGKKNALIALSIFTLSPLMIYYSAETRMYSLFVLLTLLTVLFFLSVIKKQTIINTFSFILFFTLALYAHYYALLFYIPFTVFTLKHTGIHQLRLFLFLIIPLLLFVPSIKIYFSNPHPGFISTDTIIALPATLASFILSGTGIVTLRAFFGASMPLWIKLLFSFTVVFFLLLGLKGFQYSFKSENGKFIIFLSFLPLLFMAFLNFLIPVFSVRSTIFLAPFFYILVAIGIYNLPNKLHVIILTSICLLLISVNIIVLTNNNFKGPPIKEMANKINTKHIIIHTSILTYYPFKYYRPDAENILISSNPLSPQTISIISGKSQAIPKTYQSFVLIDIINGADHKELAKIKLSLDKNYKVVNKKQLEALTLIRYEM